MFNITTELFNLNANFYLLLMAVEILVNAKAKY